MTPKQTTHARPKTMCNSKQIFDPKLPCQTRDGKQVRIYATDGAEGRIHGAIKFPNGWNATSWARNGEYYTEWQSIESLYDLINIPSSEPVAAKEERFFRYLNACEVFKEGDQKLKRGDCFWKAIDPSYYGQPLDDGGRYRRPIPRPADAPNH